MLFSVRMHINLSDFLCCFVVNWDNPDCATLQLNFSLPIDEILKFSDCVINAGYIMRWYTLRHNYKEQCQPEHDALLASVHEITNNESTKCAHLY